MPIFFFHSLSFSFSLFLSLSLSFSLFLSLSLSFSFFFFLNFLSLKIKWCFLLPFKRFFFYLYASWCSSKINTNKSQVRPAHCWVDGANENGAYWNDDGHEDDYRARLHSVSCFASVTYKEKTQRAGIKDATLHNRIATYNTEWRSYPKPPPLPDVLKIGSNKWQTKFFTYWHICIST